MDVEASGGVDEQASLRDLRVLAALAERHRQAENRVGAGAGLQERAGIGEVAGGESRSLG